MDALINGISIVIPVYNSESSLRPLTERIVSQLNQLAVDYEIIFINDGSSDESWTVLIELSKQYKQVNAICLMQNYGQHNALICGVRQARHAFIITMDDDLQHPPEEIPKLITAMTREVDVVYGKPYQEPHGLWRGFASRITKASLFIATKSPAMKNLSAFRVFRTDLRRGFDHYNDIYVSLDVLLTWSTNRFGVVEVIHQERISGKSHYTFSKLVRHAFNMLTGFSILPLRFASITGFLFTMIGLVVFVYVFVVYISSGGSVPGFPFLASIIAVFSGAQLFALGIIGEYLARVHFRMMGKPAYVVKERTFAKHQG